jgi:hypothetical protein
MAEQAMIAFVGFACGMLAGWMVCSVRRRWRLSMVRGTIEGSYPGLLIYHYSDADLTDKGFDNG